MSVNRNVTVPLGSSCMCRCISRYRSAENTEAPRSVGRRPAAGLPEVEWLECATEKAVIAAFDAGAIEVAILDGEATPAGGMGIARQVKDEIFRCPPVLVLIGVVIGQPMNLVFTPLEVAAVAAAVGISALIALDGESNWMEGALLMIVYAILAVSFFEFV